MGNRVYYGEYTLRHWLDLILKKNIVLPEYQRYFVWDENRVKTLIETFNRNQFVPPITIGAYTKGNTVQNLIIDGQQRLTSLLLACLNIFPDKTKYSKLVENYANENDDITDDEDMPYDNLLEWRFSVLTEKGSTLDEIRDKILEGNYKTLGLTLTDDFLKTHYLGFCYLVPETSTNNSQKKFYSSVFRNINIQGEPLQPVESRQSLYFLDESLIDFFEPSFGKEVLLDAKKYGGIGRMDFVRYMSLLTQYHVTNRFSSVAYGYRFKMEKYYEEYIYSVVGEVPSDKFGNFETLFPRKDFTTEMNRLTTYIDLLNLKDIYSSIINMDMYFMGLIYHVVILKHDLIINNIEGFRRIVQSKIDEYKKDKYHSRNPAALKHLKARMESSINIYNRYISR